jgi:GNAT superfamily N-acetyltransferase
VNVYDPEPLDGGHDLSGFESGEPGLDAWLQRSALESQKKGTGRTFVWVVQGDRQRRVVAYYTLAAHVIEREQLSKRPGRGMPRQLPAVLLGRLALDRTLHGQGLGGAVLAEAISRVVKVSTQLGARYLVVDALHVRAAEFYQHYGFVPVPDQQSLRLVMRIRPELLHP